MGAPLLCDLTGTKSELQSFLNDEINIYGNEAKTEENFAFSDQKLSFLKVNMKEAESLFICISIFFTRNRYAQTQPVNQTVRHLLPCVVTESGLVRVLLREKRVKKKRNAVALNFTSKGKFSGG